MTLCVEIRDGASWRTIGRLAPGEPSGSISHNAPDGRQIYRFTAVSSALSRIERSVGGVDFEVGALRVIAASAGFEEVSRLTAENPKLVFWLRTDLMTEVHEARFRHE